MSNLPLADIDDEGVFRRSQGITPENLKKEGRFGIVLALMMAGLAVWGAFLVILGAAQVSGYVPFWEKDRFGVSSLQTVTYLIAGALFGSVGFGSLLWRSDIVIHPAKKTWRMRRGILPFVQWRHGTYDDLVGLLLQRETTGGRVRHWLYLRWQVGKWQPYRLRFCGSGERVAHRTAEAYARALNLPLVEN
ncbi:MAG: hypothetical protein SFU56_01835 [Capsulimonadales bacterium]|nr:hypothetical protein [Capsulimonadales bacterium]